MPDGRRAWAAALFQAAPDAAARDAYDVALDGMARALDMDQAFESFFLDPGVKALVKAAFLESALDSSEGLSAEAVAVFRRFSELAARKGRLGLLRQISAAYRALVDAESGRARIEIQCATEPSPETVEKIRTAWRVFSGARDCLVAIRKDESLVAGYRLRAASVRYDYSVKGRLERLRRDLARPLGPSAGGTDEREEGLYDGSTPR